MPPSSWRQVCWIKAHTLRRSSVIQQGVALARALEITPLLVIALTASGNVSRAMLALEAAHAAHSEALALCKTLRCKRSSNG